MRKIYLIILLIVPAIGFSQNVGINATGAAPNNTAMLDVTSVTSGFLAPRMTSAQRLAIAGPANGLMVYDITLACFYVYSTAQTTWKSLCDLDGPYYAETTTVYNPAGSVLLKTVSVNSNAGDTIHIEAEFDYAKGLTASYVAIGLYRNGVEIHEIAKYSVANADNSIKMTWMDVPAAGTQTYTLRYYMGAGTMGFIYGSNMVVTIKN
jgi:hypothetical protein